ncbi:MAG: hypothetical protein HC778_08595 [Chamaesiphon sp. CSU_1_12]|nr:hypothetical protein [Chamaesiphon sp. CSU_1_12]
MTEPMSVNRSRYNLSLPLIGATAPMTGGLQPDLAGERHSQHNAIESVLKQVLAPLGVRFKFSIQPYAQTQPAANDSDRTFIQSPDDCTIPLNYRLWVRCSAQKSLDCQLIAPPLAQALRGLDLYGFRDAIVEFSAASIFTNFGSNLAPDRNWRLKLDLTPPIVRLRHWARWGDVQAIARLVNFALAPEGVQVSATLKNLTLQIFCTLVDPQAGKFLVKKPTIDRIAPLLIELSPQGIQGATIHGLHPQNDEPPAWVHWLDLPALGNPKFSPTPIILAARGHKAAIKFILERLLNPDLDRCFEVGGIGLSLLYRQNILYVMSEAPTCPIQSQVATTVVKVLQQLALPGIKGIRVHGRISGYSISQWTYGVDFNLLPLELPPVVPKRQFVPQPSLPKIGLAERISQYLVKTGIWKLQLTIDTTSQLAYQPRFRWQPSLLLFIVGLGCAIASNVAIESVMKSRQIAADAVVNSPQLSFNNPLLEQKTRSISITLLATWRTGYLDRR